MVEQHSNFSTPLRRHDYGGYRDYRGFGRLFIITFCLLALPAWAQNPTADARKSFIELSTDKAELYVQEQLLLTVQLYFNNELIRGELSEPVSNNAVIESLGPQQEYARVRGDQRYRMIERRYAVYPQTPGRLSLAPVEFEGSFRGANGRLQILRSSEQLFDLPVKDIPPQFSGSVWLPATGLTLEESGLPSDNRVTRGANLTRQLTLRANGLPGATLPPFPAQTVPGLRSYPEPAKRATDISADGLMSMLQQASALVPVQAGELRLPEVRVPWWDTASDSEKVAIIPERVLVVAPGAGINTQAQAPAVAAIDENLNNAASDPDPGSDTSSQNTTGGGAFWPWLALFMAVGWSITAGFFWRARRSRYPANKATESNAGEGDSELYRELLAAAGNNNPDTPRLLLRWMNLQYPDKGFQSWRQVAEFCHLPPLTDALAKLEQRRYSIEQPLEDEVSNNPAQLQQAIRELIRRPAGQTVTSGLSPLYPPAIDASQQ
ncbi:oxygen tolerance protein BatD [Marinobacter sp. LV10R520-4]|uniref:BatD family protein n=1 Tax=Marinobacter sp. LV10R520-4 TaxID=1761796 RepID=UPI000BF2CCE6|nr:BatD family protein [Marinobacter sp. LV10R520-4]PFG53637.1 oxygen tolerance protein BatD [Marinobacter sp. LV10R520-4]